VKNVGLLLHKVATRCLPALNYFHSLDGSTWSTCFHSWTLREATRV